MAQFDALWVPADEAPTKVALNNTTASAEQAFGPNVILSINATNDCYIKFGAPGSVTDPTNANAYRIPANTTFQFMTPREASSFKFYNDSGAGINIYIQRFTV